MTARKTKDVLAADIFAEDKNELEEEYYQQACDPQRFRKY